MTRLEALRELIEMPNASIEELEIFTKCPSDELLRAWDYNRPYSTQHGLGWFAARTCRLEFNRQKNFESQKGNIEFWIGAIDGWLLKS